ncbi:pectate lyase [Fusarium sp. NRRL 52700]|nr:pectate lyase [Fusarium sp. NRRL 52700]
MRKAALLTIATFGSTFAALQFHNQCGGGVYTGGAKCPSGSIRVEASKWYGQCIPDAKAGPSPKAAVEKSNVELLGFGFLGFPAAAAIKTVVGITRMLEISDFYVEDYGKLVRSCGNCKNNGGPRNVVIDNVVAVNGGVLCGMNINYGNTCTISNACRKNCGLFEGDSDGSEPSKHPSGPGGASCKADSFSEACYFRFSMWKSSMRLGGRQSYVVISL